jgi:hypothetical protein
VLTGIIVAVLLAAVAAGGEVDLAQRAPQFVDEPAPAEPVTTTPPVEVSLGVQRASSLELPAFVEVIARILFYVCLAVFAVVASVVLWRHRPRFQWPRWRRRARADFDVLDDVAATITADASAQRAALGRGAPRNAIVECWLRLEATVTDAGVERNPADTSAELTERVLAGHDVDGAAISILAALYRAVLRAPDGGGVASRGDRGARCRPRRTPVRTRFGDGDHVTSWKKAVALIAGVTIVVEVLMVATGMGPHVILVAALCTLVGVGAWFVVDLARVAVGAGGAVAPLPVEPAARSDRRVMRLRSGLAYGRADGASLENLRVSLVDLVDDQLRSAHRIDRREDPVAARVVLGDELDAFVNDPDAAAVLLKPRSLDRILTLIERL